MSFTSVVTIKCDHPQCKTTRTAANRWDAWFDAKKAGWLCVKADHVLCPEHRPAKPAKAEKPAKANTKATKPAKTVKANKPAKPVAKPVTNPRAQATAIVAKAGKTVGQSIGKPARTAKAK